MGHFSSAQNTQRKRCCSWSGGQAEIPWVLAGPGTRGQIPGVRLEPPSLIHFCVSTSEISEQLVALFPLGALHLRD